MFAVTFALANLILGFGVFAESFDKPVRQQTVDLGQSIYLKPGEGSHVQLSCSYYSGFMVKELDDPGLKGTRWVTITHFIGEHAPLCRHSHDPAERFVAKSVWTFMGMKGPLLFLEAADGDDGGMPFRILDLKTGRKVFEDVRDTGYPELKRDPGFDFERAATGETSLKYLRVVKGDCSIPKDGASCWTKFVERFRLASVAMPECIGYDGERPIPTDEVQTFSVIAYPVEVTLMPRPSVQAVSGPMKCRPEE